MLIILGLFYSQSDECYEFGERGDEQSHSRDNDAQKRPCSEHLMAEQIISECEKQISGRNMSHLTFEQYQNMDVEQKSRISNCIRQWALKVRNALPSDHGIFCLVVSHLLKNAHRYFNMNEPSELQRKILENKVLSEDTKQDVISQFKEANKKVREVRDLKE